MIVILIENIQFFFDSVHNDPKIITFSELQITPPPLKDKKILPPSNIGTLNPQDCACLLRLHISGPRATQTYFCDDPKKNIFLQ